MATQKTIQITGGPNNMQIMFSLFDEHPFSGDGRRQVFFTLDSIPSKKIALSIDSATRRPFKKTPEDWMLYGWDSGALCEVEYSSVTRKGTLKYLDDRKKIPGFN